MLLPAILQKWKKGSYKSTVIKLSITVLPKQISLQAHRSTNTALTGLPVLPCLQKQLLDENTGSKATQGHKVLDKEYSHS